MISPFSRVNYVSNTLTDQTSVLAFVENNWLSGQRVSTSSYDNLAGAVNDMFNFQHPDFRPLLLNPSTGEPSH